MAANIQQLPFDFSPGDDLDSLILESVKIGLDPVAILHDHLGGDIDWSWCRSKVLTVVVRELRIAYQFTEEFKDRSGWRERVVGMGGDCPLVGKD